MPWLVVLSLSGELSIRKGSPCVKKGIAEIGIWTFLSFWTIEKDPYLCQSNTGLKDSDE